MTDLATQPATAVETAAPVQTPAADPAPAPRDDMAALYPDDVPAADDAPAGDDAAPEPDGGVEAAPEADAIPEPEPEPEGDPIPAPASWSKDYKAEFDALPRGMKEVIAKRETERDRFVQAKAQEVVTERRRIEHEAQQVILQIHRAQADQLEEYAGLLGMEEPDVRLLQSNDPAHHALYYQQDREYRVSSAQRQRAQQESQNARQQAEALEAQATQAEQAREIALLEERIPEWSDPSARSKLLNDLGSIGAELGYSPEQMQEARASDIFALRQASEWKAKAAKFDQLNKDKMVPVRAAKALPPVARSGAPIRQSLPKSIAQSLYPND